MFKRREEQKKRKELKQLEEIAEAFLKARGVYPPGYEGFLLVAGQEQVEQFYATMLILDTKAETLGYKFEWCFDEAAGEWLYTFSEVSA